MKKGTWNFCKLRATESIIHKLRKMCRILKSLHLGCKVQQCVSPVIPTWTTSGPTNNSERCHNQLIFLIWFGTNHISAYWLEQMRLSQVLSMALWLSGRNLISFLHIWASCLPMLVGFKKQKQPKRKEENTYLPSMMKWIPTLDSTENWFANTIPMIPNILYASFKLVSLYCWLRLIQVNHNPH